MQSSSFDNCVHHYNVEVLNLIDTELQLINTRSVIKNRLKRLLSKLKKFNIQTTLFLNYKKRNDQKSFILVLN